VKKSFLPLVAFLSCAAALTAGPGCSSSPPSRFYLLRAAEDPPGEAMPAAGGVAVGVGPVRIAGYLDRPQIVTRTTPNELSLSEYDRWAGSLEENISDVVVQNLSRMLRSERVFVYPWSSAAPIDFRVKLDIAELDGKPGDAVTLRAYWTVAREGEKGGDGGKGMTARSSRISEKVAGTGYEAVVEAMSRALASLSREIAEEIRNVP
jgi:uncharacterized lipoprotein YmbA